MLCICQQENLSVSVRIILFNPVPHHMGRYKNPEATYYSSQDKNVVEFLYYYIVVDNDN